MAYERSLRPRLLRRVEELGCAIEETKPVHAWGTPGQIKITAPEGLRFERTSEPVAIVEHGACVGVTKEEAYAEALEILDGLSSGAGTQNPPIRAKRVIEMLEARKAAHASALEGLGPKEKGRRIELRTRMAELDDLVREIRSKFVLLGGAQE